MVDWKAGPETGLGELTLPLTCISAQESRPALHLGNMVELTILLGLQVRWAREQESTTVDPLPPSSAMRCHGGGRDALFLSTLASCGRWKS